MSQLWLIASVGYVLGCGRIAFDPADGPAPTDAPAPDGPLPARHAAYIKSLNADAGDQFGLSVALSRDGSTLAAGAPLEASAGPPFDNTAQEAGAVYVFRRSGDSWIEEAYLKASNVEAGDQFGWSVALSGDGSTLVIGARREDASTTDPSTNGAMSSGAAYVFRRTGETTWTEQAYLKASTIDAGDSFGERVAISADATTIAVSAPQEDSSTNNIDGDQVNDSALEAGAVYVFTFTGSAWQQQAYIKANNTGAGDELGYRLALSADGGLLVAGAYRDDSAATGIQSTLGDDAATNAGAAHVFTRSGVVWSQTLSLKASNTDLGDNFGYAVALAPDASTVVVTAESESSAAQGANGVDTDNSAMFSGAGYVFGTSPWLQTAYLKASNTDVNDQLGYCVTTSDTGDTIAIGAIFEDGSATGIGGDATSNASPDSGAVYVYDRAGGFAVTYVKATNTGDGDQFGWACALSGAADTLAVGAPFEDGSSRGIDGPGDEAAGDSGAVYVYY